MMVYSVGFTCHPKKPSVFNLLHKDQPLITPSAIRFSAHISTPDDQRHYHHLLLPEDSNLPSGMVWKLSTGIAADDLKALLQEVSHCAFLTLLSLLDHPLVENWLTVVSNQPKLFATKVIPYSQFGLFYPSVDINKTPTSMVCHHSIALWIDMRYSFIWRLVLDCIRAQSNPKLATTMHCYIQHATTAFYASTYAGNIPLANMFPNILYHFQPHNGWPGILCRCTIFVSSVYDLNLQPHH